MDRQLLKLYLMIVLVLTIIFAPMIIGHTSDWARETMTQLNLRTYKNSASASSNVPEKGKANILIVMDDGWETQYTCGYPILKSYNMKASIAVVTGLVGQPGYMDYQALAKVYMDGFDLVNHTSDHVNLATLNVEEQKKQINNARSWLEGHLMGRGKNIVVFPEGGYTKETLQILEDEEYSVLRSLNHIWNHGQLRQDTTIINLISDLPAEEAISAVNEAIAHQSTVVFILHKIEPVIDTTQMQFDKEKFTHLIEYIDSRRDMVNVLTLTEWMAMGSLCLSFSHPLLPF